MGMAGAIGAAAAASLAGSAISASAAGDAAKQQSQAAQAGINNQNQIWGQVQNYFSPYVASGSNAINNYNAALPGITSNVSNIQTPNSLSTSFKPFTPEDLTQTPGYQFTLNQGLQATQNGFSAQGLNNSGAATKGAAQYAQGLASNTYNQQLQNYLAQTQQGLAQQQQGYNQGLSNAQFGLNKQQTLNNLLFGAAGLGQNAVSSLSNAGLGNAAQINNLLGMQGNAAAAGTVGQANAYSSGLSNIGSLASTYGILNGLNPSNPNISNNLPLNLQAQAESPYANYASSVINSWNE